LAFFSVFPAKTNDAVLRMRASQSVGPLAISENQPALVRSGLPGAVVVMIVICSSQNWWSQR
jgi:hypothetical protein